MSPHAEIKLVKSCVIAIEKAMFSIFILTSSLKLLWDSLLSGELNSAHTFCEINRIKTN